MSKAKTVDLTSGPILKTLAELALPIMISSMLGTAYSIMDMAWIGLLGAKAVAGVGVGGMYVWLSQGLASLSRMGGQVNTAQACGRKDYDQARSYAAGSLQLTALSGILFAAVCVIFIQPLLGFFNLTDAETYTAARSYTLITCGLILFSYLNLTLTGLSTAQGDSRTPLLANFIGLAGNMILDPLLILGIGPFPRLEVAGAAIATVSSQILVFVVMVMRIRHSRLEPNVLQHLNLLSVFPKEYYKHIFRIGFPTAIQGSIYCFISMILTRMVSEVAHERADLNDLTHGLVTEDHVVAVADGALPHGMDVRSAGRDGDGAHNGVQRSAQRAFLFNPTRFSDPKHCVTLHKRPLPSALFDMFISILLYLFGV